MFDAFFHDNFQFQANSLEHLASVMIFLILGVIFIWFARFQTEPCQRKLSFWIGIWILVSQIAKTFIRLYLGNFDAREDLPLHLCNLIPFFIPWALLYKWRAVWAVLFLWIMAGTFQSLITPTLEHSFPHYEFFRYWVVHIGLVVLAILPVFNWNWRLYKRDILMGLLGINLLALVMYFVNLGLDANYMYLLHKPEGKATLYDVLGPWPWYILSLEFVALFLFSLLYLPFFYLERQKYYH